MTIPQTMRAAVVRDFGRPLSIEEWPVPRPGPGEVLVRIAASGVCHTDLHAADGDWPVKPAVPFIPGHEGVGRVAALGAGVSHLEEGDLVGIAWLHDACGHCEYCITGWETLCEAQHNSGYGVNGCMAEYALGNAAYVARLPEHSDPVAMAPILCAGIATFNALKKSGAEAGDTVAVFGIGGLGHMAVQYAHKMGFRVVAIGRGADIATDALALGAHLYIDTEQEDAAEALKALGGAKAILSTPVHAAPVAALMPGISPEGRMVLLGVAKDPLPVAMGPLISGERGAFGSITGSPYENEKTLDFSVLTGVRPMIETMPLERAAEAYAKMKSGDVKFRMVLTMEKNRHAPS